jgi:hypothetical protein
VPGGVALTEREEDLKTLFVPGGVAFTDIDLNPNNTK